MERTKLQHLREEVRKAHGKPEKRKEICEKFFAGLDEADPDGEAVGICSCCGKQFKPGDRRFHFQGWDQEYCDHCFCDAIEIEIYRNHGLTYEDEDGGSTIWVEVEGEENAICTR